MSECAEQAIAAVQQAILDHFANRWGQYPPVHEAEALLLARTICAPPPPGGPLLPPRHTKTPPRSSPAWDSRTSSGRRGPTSLSNHTI